jgi:tail tube protein
MGDISTASGSKVYIGNAVTTAQADTLAEFIAMSGWTEIGLVESIGEFGDESADVTFSAIGDSRVRHAKGARDAGTMTVTAGHDPTDPGQAAMVLAEQSSSNFAFRVTLNDGPPGFSDTDLYFRGLVRSRRKNIGTNDNVVRNTYNVGVNSEIFENTATSQ